MIGARPPVGDRPGRPASPLAWGWRLGVAGLAPFVLCAAAALGGVDPWGVSATGALLAYGALIVSFLGGVHWGVVLADGTDDGGGVRAGSGRPHAVRALAWGVTPAVLGWAALLIGGGAGLALLIATFAGALAVDLDTVRRGGFPGWYRPLRIALTIGAVAALGAGLAAASGFR